MSGNDATNECTNAELNFDEEFVREFAKHIRAMSPSALRDGNKSSLNTPV
jgi:hypothetical protein